MSPRGRAVEDRIGDHGDRIHGRVQIQQIALLPMAGEGVGAGIMPHIAAVAPKPAELDVVAVRGAALLEDKHELVPAAVERSHPAVVFDPNSKVL